MYFNVAQLLKETTGATRKYDLVDDISQLDPELEPLNPLVGTLQILRTHSGVLISGELSTAVRVNCDRCLGPFVMPVRFTLQESFRPLTDIATGRYIRPDEFEGSASDLEDEALLINENHILNLAEVVRQAIWLSLPMYPTCDDAGLEQCTNEESIALMQENSIDIDEIEQSEPPLDPRWAGLLSLKHDLEKNDGDDARIGS